MAELKKPLFGNIKGSFGNAVFRQRNGKNILVQKPASYTLPETEDYQVRTTKFRMSAKISSVINSVDTLKQIWNDVKPKNQSLYNHLISLAYPYVTVDSVNSSLKIVPDSKVGVRLNNVNLLQDKLTVNLLPLTVASMIDPVKEKNGELISLITLVNPIGNELPDLDVVAVKSNLVPINLDSALSFEFIISTTNQMKLSSYQNKSLFSSLITYDENFDMVHYSNTFFADLS
ncbi:MAG: hypothetical protein N3E37_05315 [Candidatus Micrarchaeota archaeon]|nr:hypothetical protein [Candidatus Micrarchaeota archaeon]